MTVTSEKRAVGRPRQFDEEQALEAVMEVFWSKGFESTSLGDLCAATGLHKGSLYQAFGDKHSLFMRALRHYLDREFRDTAAVAFQHDSPLESVRAVVRSVCRHTTRGKGCLMINSLVELGPHDPEVQEVVTREAGRRLRVLTDLIERARERGEIRPELEPAQLARQLMISFAGSSALSKGVVEPDAIVGLLDGIVDQWT